MRFASLYEVTSTGRAIKTDAPRSPEEAFMGYAYRVASLYQVTNTGRGIKSFAGFQGPGGGMFMGPGGQGPGGMFMGGQPVRGGGAGNVIDAFHRRDCQIPLRVGGMMVDTGQPDNGPTGNIRAFQQGLHIGQGNRASTGGGGQGGNQGGMFMGMGRNQRGGMFMGPGGGMFMGPGGGNGPFGNFMGPGGPGGGFGPEDEFGFSGGPGSGPGPGGPFGPGPGGFPGGPGPGGMFMGPGPGGMFQGPGGMFMGPGGRGPGGMGMGGGAQQAVAQARGTNCGGGVRQIDVMVQNKQGQFQTIRGLIDSGAGVALMDPQVGQMLGFGRQDAVRTIQAMGEQAQSNNVPLINIMVMIPPDDKPLAMQAALFADGQDGVFTPFPTCDLTMRVNIDIDQGGHTITSQSNGMSMRYDCMGGRMMGGRMMGGRMMGGGNFMGMGGNRGGR